MYVPAHFAETRVEVMHGLIRRHPLGVLVVNTAQGLEANHVPFEIDPAPAPFGTLRCHVARANGVWRELETGGQVLIVFQGPEAYITPSSYATKQQDGKVVPTWNYAVVHAYGKAAVVHDAPWLRALVGRLTNQHEAPRAAPWAVEDAPLDYVEKMLRAIVGLEIPVERMVGKWKMSQNRSVLDRRGVATELRQSEADSAVAMADVIERLP